MPEQRKARMTERICSSRTCPAPASRRLFQLAVGAATLVLRCRAHRRAFGRATGGMNGTVFIPGWLAVENVQNRAIRHRFPGTPANGSREQAFELHKIIDLGADVVEVMFGDL